MFTVKFVGGAKKSFPTEQLSIDKSDISIKDLIDMLLDLKPADTPKLDTENILIAINGSDSSAMDGQSTKIRDNDTVSIIPIIHGGSPRKLVFEFSKKQIQVMEIKGQRLVGVKFLDDLRTKHPKILLQAVSSNFIQSAYHLKKIISLSIESKRNNNLLANKLETDILMRFALTTQISDAIKNAGIKTGANFILIALGNKKTLNSMYADLLPLSTDMFSKNNEPYIKKHFEITSKYLGSVHSKNPLADILVEKATILF